MKQQVQFTAEIQIFLSEREGPFQVEDPDSFFLLIEDFAFSLLETLFAIPQLLGCVAPVFLGRALRTTFQLPELVGQRGDLVVTEHREAVFIQPILPRLSRMLVSQAGVFEGLT
jgi:hypothetical protein